MLPLLSRQLCNLLLLLLFFVPPTLVAHDLPSSATGHNTAHHRYVNVDVTTALAASGPGADMAIVTVGPVMPHTTDIYQSYTATITNIGTETAYNVVLTNYFIAGFSPGAFARTSGLSASGYGSNATSIWVQFDSIPVGGTSTYRFNTKPSCSIANAAVFNNRFAVSATTDTDSTNDTSSVIITTFNPPPTFTSFPSDITVSTGATATTCTANVPSLGAYTTSDNCPNVTVNLTGVPPGNDFPAGTTVVTYTATDAGGSQVVRTQNVTVNDNAPPVPDIASLPAVNGECSYTFASFPTATDNCGGSITGTTTDPLTYNTQGTYTVTWIYTDGSANSSSQTQTVVIDDLTGPVPDVATLPDVTGECGATVGSAPTATDGCAGAVTGTTSDPLTYNAQGSYTITWTYDDGNGNTTTQTQQVVVDDITAPVPDVANLPDITGGCSVTVTTIPTATDACEGAITGTTTDPLTYSVYGNYVITWSFDDGNGNTSTQTQNVSVAACPDLVITLTDPGQPHTTNVYRGYLATITNVGNAPANNVTLYNYSTAGLSIGAMSYVSGLTASSIGGSAIGIYAQYNSFPAGATSTYRVNNKPSCDVADGAVFFNRFKVTAPGDVDTTNDSASVIVTASNPAPLFTSFPADISTTTGAGNPNCSVVVAALGAYTVTDNCPNPTVTLTGVPVGNAFPVGTTVVTYTASDLGGAQTVRTQNVTVTDNTPPVPDVATLPDIVVECSATISTPPTATDNCSGTLNGTTTDPLTYTIQGTYTITWAYNDGNGNSTTQTQTVIVDDVTAPVPDAEVLPTLAAECGYTVTVIPTATDNCLGTINGTTTDPLVYTAQGTYTITWTFDDGNGNSTTQTQTVVIDDITAPVPNIASLPNVTGQCSATIPAAPTATDNCVGSVTGTTTDPLSYSVQGTYTVTWTYNDGNGNTSTQTQTVIVDDVTAPVPNVATLPTVTGECSATIPAAPTATDNCVGTVTGTTTDPLSYTVQGTYTVTWSYNDGNGNTSTQTQTVIVDDITAPVPNVASLPTITGECSATIPAAPTATDNCVGSVTGTTVNPLSYSAQGTYTVTWTYNDGNGNTSTQTQTVIVDDITAPVPNVASLPTITQECSYTLTTAPTATDNCVGTVTATTTAPLPITYNVQGTYTVVWTYNDGNGNTSTQNQTIVIDDNTAPVPNVNPLPTLTAECSVAVASIPTATDNCTGTITATTTNPLTYSTQGTYTITWTYNDGNGNISTQTQTIIVQDITPPVVTCPRGSSVEADANDQALIPNILPNVTATDNCTPVANLRFSQSPVSGTTVGLGVTPITVTVLDIANNAGTCSTDFTVVQRVIISPSSNALNVAFGCNLMTTFSRSVTINNTGGHFNGGVLQWTASTTAAAISITTASGVEGGTLAFTVDPTGLTPGSYTYYINITGWNSITNVPAKNSVYQLPVYVVVEPPVTSYTQTQSVSTSWTAFTNAYGHKFAEVKSNSGTIPSMTVNAYPCVNPPTYPRVNFIRRYWQFVVTGNVNIDFRAYYTDTETKPRVVQPNSLTMWQQPVVPGTWNNMGGTSNPTMNYVEYTNVTNIAGNWMAAHPWIQWYPKLNAINITAASYHHASRTINIDWSSLIQTEAAGFSIERCFGPDASINMWTEVGIVDFNAKGKYTFADKVSESGVYHYRVSTWDNAGNFYESKLVTIETIATPDGYTLSQNFPNPFNPETAISYSIPSPQKVTIKVYDALMRELTTLVDSELPAGTHEVRFDASALPSGTYFYRMEAGRFVQTRKMNLIK